MSCYLEFASLQHIAHFFNDSQKVDFNKILKAKEWQANHLEADFAKLNQFIRSHRAASGWLKSWHFPFLTRLIDVANLCFIRFAHWWQGWEDWRASDVIKFVDAHVAQLEADGIFLKSNQFESLTMQEKEQARSYLSSYSEKVGAYIKTVDKIEQWMNKRSCLSPRFLDAFGHLKLNITALRYRVGAWSEDPTIGLYKDKPGTEAYEESYQFLCEKATTWHKRRCERYYKDFQDPSYLELNEVDKKQLKLAACYSAAVKVMQQYPKRLEPFFGTILRNFCSVSMAVKYYTTQKFERDSLFASSKGRLRKPKQEPMNKEKGLRTYTTIPGPVKGLVRKIPHCPLSRTNFGPFQSVSAAPVNLANPTCEMNLGDGNIMTVQRFASFFKNRRFQESRISVLADGLANFHPAKGPFDATQQRYLTAELKEKMKKDLVDELEEDIKRGTVMKSFATSEIIEGELVKKWVGKICSLDQWSSDPERRQMLFIFASTRSDASTKSLDCHAFFSVLVRNKEGNWERKDLGLYAHEFQQGLIDGALKFCDTMESVFVQVEQNAVLMHRQHVEILLYPSKEKSKELLNEIYFKFIAEPRDFKFAGETNCVGSWQGLLESVFGCMPEEVEQDYLNCVERDKRIIHYRDPIEIYGFPNVSRVDVTKGSIGCKLFDNLLAFINRHKIQSVAVPILLFFLGGGREKVLTRTDGTTFKTSLKGDYQKSYKTCQAYYLYSPSQVHERVSQAFKEEKGFLSGRSRFVLGHTDKYVQGFGRNNRIELNERVVK